MDKKLWDLTGVQLTPSRPYPDFLYFWQDTKSWNNKISREEEDGFVKYVHHEVVDALYDEIDVLTKKLQEYRKKDPSVDTSVEFFTTKQSFTPDELDFWMPETNPK